MRDHGGNAFQKMAGRLKQNAFYEEKKKTDEGYNPTQKYHLVWDVMTHNMNQLIDKGGLDLTLDETTWPNSSYADIQGCLQGKKTDKGGQHVLLLDSKRRYMYAWTPRHKFFEVVQPFTATGPAEVKRLVDNITPLVVGATKDPTDKRKQIFSECVHITMDNLFNGDEVLRYLGEGGWKGTMTCRRDRLPKSVPKKYFNFIKAAPVNARSKVARFETPIVAVKHVKQPDSDEPNSDTEKKQRTTFFAMFHSNQLQEPTFPQLMHCLLLNHMCETTVRAGDSRRGHGGLK